MNFLYVCKIEKLHGIVNIRIKLYIYIYIYIYFLLIYFCIISIITIQPFDLYLPVPKRFLFFIFKVTS